MQRWPHTAAAVSFARSFTILSTREFDIIVPVPLHPTRRRERGFNQARLLAELLSARISIRCKEVLKRIRYTTTQTALDRAERIENLHNAFRLRKNADVRGLHVLLIDDVLTTGSTLSECARVLKRAGAISVYAATAARA
jgi:ComF family protein